MITPAQRVLSALEQDKILIPQFVAKSAGIANRVGGWSGPAHYYFFSSVLNELTSIKSILILGVYMGRDISFMSSACTRELNITGVDKFEDAPCDDWADKNAKTWEQAGYGKAPTLELAQKNLEQVSANHHVMVIQSDDKAWLEKAIGKYDLIYIDTAHDKATVLRQLDQIKKLCHPHTIIAGDDYENIEPTWGVKDAVTEAFKEHHVLADSIWWANAVDLK